MELLAQNRRCMFLSCHVCVLGESKPYSCLNAKKLLAQNRYDMWSLSDCNGIPTHNHLVRKQTLNHLAKLDKWLSCAVSTYLYSAFYYMLLSRNFLQGTGAISEAYVTATGFKPIYIWLYILIMSPTHLRIDLHSVVTWMSRKSFLQTCVISEI